MSVYGSLYSGVSGLSVNSVWMSVIGDNIANMNTVGYKRARVVFQDMMAFPVIGIGTENQVGRGSSLQKIEQEMTAGSFINTGNGLDLAIDGNGFFVVKGALAGESAVGYHFTRSGQFHVDNDGYLVTTAGLRVQGYPADISGTVGSALTDLQFRNTSSPASATTSVNMAVNLNAEETAIPGGFDPTDPIGTSHFNNTITIYDSLGAAHDVTIYYTKTADGTWSWNGMEQGSSTPVVSGSLTFDNQGRLTAATPASSTITFAGAAPQTVSFDFGDPLPTGTGLSGCTQFASASLVSQQGQNGFPVGDLQTVVVDPDGIVTGSFTNGQKRVLGQVATADFRGTNLRRVGSNLWAETTDSGAPLIGKPQTGTRGAISSAILEQSNVDLASEFVDMIVAQRGYQANSRTVTTADQMLQEALNMKR